MLQRVETDDNPPSKMTDKIIERYIKVKALADRGVGGEKESAAAILSDLEKRHPGIREAASSRPKEAAGNGPPPPSPYQGTYPDPFPGNASRNYPKPPPTNGNWENIFRYAQGIYETVKEVVEDASAAQYGRNLAESGVEVTAGSRERSIYVRMKIPFEVVSEARELNTLQKEAFRKAVHEMLEEYVDALLQE